MCNATKRTRAVEKREGYLERECRAGIRARGVCPKGDATLSRSTSAKPPALPEFGDEYTRPFHLHGAPECHFGARATGVSVRLERRRTTALLDALA